MRLTRLSVTNCCKLRVICSMTKSSKNVGSRNYRRWAQHQMRAYRERRVGYNNKMLMSGAESYKLHEWIMAWTPENWQYRSKKRERRGGSKEQNYG